MPQNKRRREARLDGSAELPGWPGYRTRAGRSGYDPLDSQHEAAHMEGTFYQRLFTGRLRTRNPYFLGLMALFGGFFFFFSIIFLYGTVIEWADKPTTTVRLILLVPALACSGAIAANFVINMLIIWGPRWRERQRRENEVEESVLAEAARLADMEAAQEARNEEAEEPQTSRQDRGGQTQSQ